MSRNPDFPLQPVMIPRINISLRYNTVGCTRPKVPPLVTERTLCRLENGCLVKTHLNRKTKMREACGKSLRIASWESRVQHNGNRLNGLIFGGAKSAPNGRQPGHKVAHISDRSHERDGDRHGCKRPHRDHHCHCLCRDGSPQNPTHRHLSLECRRERTVCSHRERHHDRPHHSHHHRPRGDRGHERKGHCCPCDERPHDPCKPKEESQESWEMKDKSNGKDEEGVPSREETSSPALVPDTAEMAQP